MVCNPLFPNSSKFHPSCNFGLLIISSALNITINIASAPVCAKLYCLTANQELGQGVQFKKKKRLHTTTDQFVLLIFMGKTSEDDQFHNF
jgi:hypothetical protein